VGEFQKTSVLLPTHLARLLRDAVDGKRYVVESDVVIEALMDWQLKRQVRRPKLERLHEVVEKEFAAATGPKAAPATERSASGGSDSLPMPKAAE
jgi:antitoxin ParD1/3/4